MFVFLSLLCGYMNVLSARTDRIWRSHCAAITHAMHNIYASDVYMSCCLLFKNPINGVRVCVFVVECRWTWKFNLMHCNAQCTLRSACRSVYCKCTAPNELTRLIVMMRVFIHLLNTFIYLIVLYSILLMQSFVVTISKLKYTLNLLVHFLLNWI